MASSTRPSYFKPLFALALIFALVTPLTATAQVPEPNAVFSVETPHWAWSHLAGDEVGWTEGRTLTLSIDDDFDLGNGYLYRDSMTIDGPNGDWFFDLEGAFEIVPGHVVTADDGVEIVKQLLVEALEVIEIHPEADTVTGTGPVGAIVLASASDQFGYEAYRNVEVDGEGVWIADFATPGPEPHEQDLQDIKPGTSGGAFISDDDVDSTHRGWSLADAPVFWVSTPYYPEAHQIGNWAAWTEGRTVSIHVDDDFDLDNGVLYTDSAVVGTDGEWAFDLEGLFEILPGHVVTADDGVEVTKQLLVEELEVIDVDLDADAVTGWGPIGATVVVCADEDGEPGCRSVEVGGDGMWVADFANPGSELHEQDLRDLKPGTFGGAQIYDEDGDFTLHEWAAEEPTMPTFRVFWDGNNINGADWMPNSPLTITIDNDDDPTSVLFTYEAFTDEGGGFEVGGDLAFDIQAGHYVVVTDGTSTKDHWVTTMMFADADPVTDVVTGTAAPDSFVVVEPETPARAWEHLNFQYGPNNRNPDSLNEHLAFRQAVAHAIDRDALVAQVPGADFAIDSYVDVFLPDLSQHAWAQYPYDPAAATALIDELCADLGRDCVASPPVAVFTTSTTELRVLTAGLLQTMLADVGIELQLDLEDQELFWFETFPGGTFDMSEWAYMGSPSLRALVEIHYVFDAEERFDQNWYNWGTPNSSVINAGTARMAELIGLMNATDDPALLTGYIQEAELLLADEMMFLPLYVRSGDFSQAGPIRVVQADESGNWVADFSVPWEDQDVYDITVDTTGFIFQFDDDGDATGESWEVPPDEPTVIDIAIDIKPGAYPNNLNINGHGAVPVAALGSHSFDVTQIDVTTVDFAGLVVKANRKGKLLCSFDDVSGDFTTSEGAPDGYLDLVCHFVDDPALWNPDNGTATLSGQLLPEHGATPFGGSDDFRLVPPG